MSTTEEMIEGTISALGFVVFFVLAGSMCVMICCCDPVFDETGHESGPDDNLPDTDTSSESSDEDQEERRRVFLNSLELIEV